jgi:hypothetical protein
VFKLAMLSIRYWINEARPQYRGKKGGGDDVHIRYIYSQDGFVMHVERAQGTSDENGYGFLESHTCSGTIVAVRFEDFTGSTYADEENLRRKHR